MMAQHDPGGLVRLALPPDVTGEAIFSPCGRYRTVLARAWTKQPRRWLMWCGMNPSTADGQEDDPTVQRECTRTRSLGYDGYLKVNVLDYRATHPKDLLGPGVVANSAANHPTIMRLATISEAVVMAHGNLHARFVPWADNLTHELIGDGHRLLCLGQNKNGSPKHPLYLAAETALREYRPTGTSTAESAVPV